MPAEPVAARRRSGRAAVAGPASAQRVARQERREVRLHGDRADARAAAAVRDAEGLVQVQVRDVAAELARLGQPDQGVEVGAVDVDLAAGVVHERRRRRGRRPRTRRAWTGR